MKLILLLLISFSAHAGHFTNHVKESIAINKERKVYYRELTAGKSDAVFKKLIFVEHLIVPSARIFDLRASYFQKRGVPVLENEFLPMKVPDTDVRKIPTTEFSPVPWKEYQKELRALVKNRDEVRLLSRSLEIINEMKAQPEYWCLTRHLVESIYRFAWFYPARVEAAKGKGVKSPSKLLWDIMDYHLLGFKSFVEVDTLSAPIQKEGITILCSDLPDLISDLKTLSKL